MKFSNFNFKIPRKKLDRLKVSRIKGIQISDTYTLKLS